jgi:hypothetical protein
MYGSSNDLYHMDSACKFKLTLALQLSEKEIYEQQNIWHNNMLKTEGHKFRFDFSVNTFYGWFS